MTDPAVKPDILGGDWVARTLALQPDAEGAVVATLVHRAGPPRSPRAVLYVHGFVDYFFQTHLAERWETLGFDFYALDLRKYGRSMRARQTPNICTDLAVYDEELDASAEIIRRDHDGLIVMGHSTGGLVTSLWADRRRGKGMIDALVLNSPWFDLKGNWLARGPLTWVVEIVGRFAPQRLISGLPEHYGRSIHRSAGGEWDYDLALKPLAGFPVLAGWLRAIRRGHAQLARGLAIDCPVLVACSTATGPSDRWHEAILRSDSVLDADQIAARAPRLGPHVTLERIPDGIHDLTLSPEPARSHFFAVMEAWVRQRVPTTATAGTSR